MALYRETATGFVQEYASNPGAGYTLISTMPTTSINARAEWWRDVDKWNQTSAWHPSLGSTAQDPNDNFLQIVFTNDSALVSSDANGNVTDGFLGATTQVRMMRGSQNVTLTEGWSFGLAKSPDVPAFTYTWTGTDVRTLQITGFPTDTTSGYIRITATRTGSNTQTKDFKLLKVIRGADGSDGTDGVRGSRQIVVDGTSWSDAAAWNGILAQTGTVPVLSDLVTIANAGAGFSASKFYTGGAYDGDWVTPNAYINGNLLVTGTVGADRISAGTIGAYTILLGGASSVIQSANYVPGTSGWRIKGDGVGEFQNVTIRGTLNASDITAGTLNIARIADTSITNAKISSLSADKLTAGTIDASVISVTNLNASNIYTGTLNAGAIAITNLNASNISTGTLNASRLSFTPTDASNIVGVINTSSEGLRISGSRINIDGTVSFSAGYDPASKIALGGAASDINSNITQISGGKIETNSLNANRISSGTISSQTITLNGGAIQSQGFASGYSGWQIDGAGNAEFNTAVIRKPGNIANNAFGQTTIVENASYTSSTFLNLTVGYYYYKASVGQTTNIMLALDCQTSLSTYQIELRDGADNILWTAYYKFGTAIDSRFFSGVVSFYQTVTQPYVLLKVAMWSGGGTMGAPRINIFETVS